MNMLEKNSFVFYFPCDTQNINNLELKSLNIKNIFRRDIRYIAKNNIQYVNLNNILGSYEYKIINKHSDIYCEFCLENVELIIFNQSVEKNQYYSLLVMKGSFKGDTQSFENITKNFLSFNKYNLIEITESEITPFYSIQIGDSIKNYASNILKEGKRNSIVSFFVADIVKQINTLIGLPIEDRVIMMNYEYDYHWLCKIASDDTSPISIEEHNLAKKLSNGVVVLIV